MKDATFVKTRHREEEHLSRTCFVAVEMIQSKKKKGAT